MNQLKISCLHFWVVKSLYRCWTKPYWNPTSSMFQVIYLSKPLICFHLYKKVSKINKSGKKKVNRRCFLSGAQPSKLELKLWDVERSRFLVWTTGTNVPTLKQDERH